MTIAASSDRKTEYRDKPAGVAADGRRYRYPPNNNLEEKKEEAVIELEPKEEITFEQFGAMQFQVGEIIACEAVKKSKKLLCSQVKIGSQV